MTGSHYERELVNALTDAGIPALRAPSSGSATDRPLPDVLAGSRVEIDGTTGPTATLSNTWAIELKTTSETTAYVDESEVEALGRFAYGFGAAPMIAARFKRPGHSGRRFVLVRPTDCRKTETGVFGVPESSAEERAEAIVYPDDGEQDAEVVWA